MHQLGFGESDIVNNAVQVGLDVVGAGAVFALVWFRDFFVYRMAKLLRWLYSLVTSKRYVLLWIDDERSCTEKLMVRVEAAMTGGPAPAYAFRTLLRPRSLLFFPLKRTAAVILLDSDVSKIADEPRTARRIEEALRAYVDCGGGLVGGHDLIYRRVRSKTLQNMFGCRLTQFRSPAGGGEVPYTLCPDAARHDLRNGLPDSFRLDDGEILSGDWAPDTTPIYVSEDAARSPLVVAREFGRGRIVWINSGDRADHLCGSLSKPQKSLVLLLRNAIGWTART
jgi:hypothetical protein